MGVQNTRPAEWPGDAGGVRELELRASQSCPGARAAGRVAAVILLGHSRPIEAMKDILTSVGSLTLALMINAGAAEPPGPAVKTAGAPPGSFPASSQRHPFPLLSTLGWTNLPLARPLPLQGGDASDSPIQKAKSVLPASLAVGTNQLIPTNRLGWVKASARGIQPLDRSNVLARVPVGDSDRPPPPTGLRLISAGR